MFYQQSLIKYGEQRAANGRNDTENNAQFVLRMKIEDDVNAYNRYCTKQHFNKGNAPAVKKRIEKSSKKTGS